MAGRLIPFRWLPGSWGLTGRVYEEAEACYLLEGEALERKLVEIRCAGDEVATRKGLLALDLKYKRITAYEHDKGVLEIDGTTTPDHLLALDLKHGRIDSYTRDRLMAEMTSEPGSAREVAFLEVDLRHGKLDKLAHDKARASILEEPWIGIIDQGFDPSQGVNGVYFEFDWNDYWIAYLRMHSYTGPTEDAIVEAWFQDVCRSTVASDTTSMPFSPDGMQRAEDTYRF